MKIWRKVWMLASKRMKMCVGLAVRRRLHHAPRIGARHPGNARGETEGFGVVERPAGGHRGLRRGQDRDRFAFGEPSLEPAVRSAGAAALPDARKVDGAVRQAGTGPVGTVPRQLEPPPRFTLVDNSDPPPPGAWPCWAATRPAAVTTPTTTL